jgi:hypothetical protein
VSSPAIPEHIQTYIAYIHLRQVKLDSLEVVTKPKRSPKITLSFMEAPFFSLLFLFYCLDTRLAGGLLEVVDLAVGLIDVVAAVLKVIVGTGGERTRFVQSCRAFWTPLPL